MNPDHRSYNRPSALAMQFLPPLLLLWPALARTDLLLYLGAVISLVAILFSLGSLALRLRRPPARRGRLLRPVLAIGLATLSLVHFASERNLARIRINSLAASVQNQCRVVGQCPTRISGWPDGSGRIASEYWAGTRVRHHYVYVRSDDSFELQWVIGAGFAESSRGGVDRPFRPIGAIPGF